MFKAHRAKQLTAIPSANGNKYVACAKIAYRAHYAIAAPLFSVILYSLRDTKV